MLLGYSKLRSLFIVIDLHADVQSIKSMSFATETQKWAPFPVLTSYKIFHAAGNNIKSTEVFTLNA